MKKEKWFAMKVTVEDGVEERNREFLGSILFLVVMISVLFVGIITNLIFIIGPFLLAIIIAFLVSSLVVSLMIGENIFSVLWEGIKHRLRQS